MIERHTTQFPFYGEPYADFMSFVTQYYSENPAVPKEILLPDPDGLAALTADEAAEFALAAVDPVQEGTEPWGTRPHSGYRPTGGFGRRDRRGRRGWRG